MPLKPRADDGIRTRDTWLGKPVSPKSYTPGSDFLRVKVPANPAFPTPRVGEAPLSGDAVQLDEWTETGRKRCAAPDCNRSKSASRLDDWLATRPKLLFCQYEELAVST